MLKLDAAVALSAQRLATHAEGENREVKSRLFLDGHRAENSAKIQDEQTSESKMTWRIGAVSYLNTKPLIHQLEKHLSDCELSLDLPSRLADRIAAGDLDVALIPSVEYLRGDGLTIVSDACIACRGPVRSVRILFRKPPSQVKSLALDEGSRTSAALAQVLLAERFGLRPQRQQLDIDAAISDCDADAILVIGDRAMDLDTRDYCESWDLGEQWCQETGLSFVFAMWVARFEVPPEVSHALQAARDAGLASLDEIVAREAPRYHLSTVSCNEYFRHHLHFHLGPAELSGLRLFRVHAVALGLVPPNTVSIPEALPVV